MYSTTELISLLGLRVESGHVHVYDHLALANKV